MNKKLGRGINFGNSWESEGSNDCAWSNCIQDGWFKIARDAGFNSIRLPVRWEIDADYNGNLSSSRLAGVKEDINLALAQGFVVIVNAHHHNTLNDAAANYSSNPSKYNTEKQKFLKMWKKIASEMNSYDDDKIVLEILNEPHGIQMAQVNDLMTSAYQVIRQNAPGKTIMFESAGYSKFGQIPNLDLPADGNIIVSGHYYDPYTFTHQGHEYDYNANASFSETTIENDFKSYADSIAVAFPDVNGGCVPINMGEFGVASTNGGSGISETKRAQWTEAVIQQAEKYGFSWHYWGFAGVGGFEAYNKGSNSWYSEIKAVFDKYLGNPSTVK
jgi:aryl-phospho-beta-D-glucosidase BglC (GH1 family)